MAIEFIDSELCNGCRICVDSCPQDVIRMDKTTNKAVIQYAEECMVCEACADECPLDAIRVSPTKNMPYILAWG